MKRGTTPTLEIKLELNASNVTNVYFTFKEKVEDSENYLLQKNYPDDAEYDSDNQVFILPLTQEDTLKLTDTYFLEAEVVIGGKSVIKSDIGKEIMQPTLYTEVISGNESNGESDVISLSFTDYVKGEGGSSSDYNDLNNKPRINGVTLSGNKSADDLNLASKSDLNSKADKSDTYTKEEVDNKDSATLQSAKDYTDQHSGGTYTEGKGINIENDEISVALNDDIYNLANFNRVTNALEVEAHTVGYDETVRESLTDDSFNYALASKQYVDNLMSGATKWEFVSQLPTENIDIHTIYFVPKQSAETDNVYDEWVYAIQSRNPDVYDWELLGTSQVDLTNYYTKTESDNRYNAKLTVGNGIDITNDTISTKIVSSGNILKFASGELVVRGSDIVNDAQFKNALPYDATIRERLLQTSGDYNFQPKLTAGTNITIDSNNVISASGGSGGSYSGGDGIDITNSTISIDLKSGSKLQFDNGELDVDLSGKQDTIDSSHKLSADYIELLSNSYLVSVNGELAINSQPLGVDTNLRQSLVNTSVNYPLASKSYTDTELAKKQDTIDSTHKLSADNVDDTNTTNKFVTSTDKSTWSGKQDPTTISTDTTSTTVSLTLADNHEYRYTQTLTSLTLTMPSGDFIASVVFASGSTPTSMTYDSSIKWSGDDVTNGQFVPTEKTYNIVMWYDGINVNGVVRGV